MTIDWQVFHKNRKAFPPEELARYAGQWVAWSPDGSRILAHSGESQEKVRQILEADGHDVSCCCLSYVLEGTDAILGGGSLFATEPDQHSGSK